MRVFKLKFHSALHVDSRGSGDLSAAEESVRSDTLSAALCLAHAALYPQPDETFFLNPPFKISSAFPYVGDILLFPMPAWRIWKELDASNRKRLKEIRWISQGLFERVLSGQAVAYEEVESLPCGIAVLKAEIKGKPALCGIRPWVMDERQRVSVDRFGSRQEGGLFFFALQFFAPQCGLYFLADVADEHMGAFRAALSYLGDTGLGADRNSGLGHFSLLAEESFPAALPKKAGGTMTLSLFNPGIEDGMDELTAVSAYGLVTRSGWIFNSTVGRPPVRAFTEGSYFSSRPQGRVVPMLSAEVRAKYDLPIFHSAPRDFRAFTVPCAEPPFLKEKQP